MARYRGTGGAEFDLDVPNEGSQAREHFDRQVINGDLVAIEDVENDDSVKPATIADIKADVGDDREKAQAALDAENASDEPRSTLVKHLEAIVAEGD